MRMKFLNIYIDNLTMEETLLKIDELIKAKKRSYVVTPNVDHIVRVEYDVEFKKIYNEANLILTDGKPLIWISKLMENSIKEKVSGSDLFPRLCTMAAHKKYKMFFWGAKEGVANRAANILVKKNEGLQIVGTYSPPFDFENDETEIKKILSLINDAKPDILIVALGSPKQERFMYEYKDKLDVFVSLGLGASLDFEAGNITRAPKWISNAGFEWLYRFVHEPKRLFKRYFINDMKIIKIIWKYKKQFKSMIHFL